MSLVDIHLKEEYSFTWFKCLSIDKTIGEKLNRVMESEESIHLFLNVTLELTYFLMLLGSKFSKKQVSFKFENV